MKNFKIAIIFLILIIPFFSACNRSGSSKQAETADVTDNNAGNANSAELTAKIDDTVNVPQAVPVNLPPQTDVFKFSPESEYGGTRYPDKGESFIRMWGWSKDGKAAFSVDNYGYAKGGFSVNYYIIDTITDSILCNLVFDSEDFDISQALTLENSNLLYNINLHTELIKEVNAKYGIIENYADFQSFPANINGKQYTSSAEVRSENDEGFAKINYDINVIQNGKSKKLGSYSQSGPNLSLFICGYFKSPHENRILVVSAVTSPFSGDVYTYFKFSGCHLDVGF